MITHILKLIWNKKGRNALMMLEILLSFLVLFFVLAYVLFNLEKTNAPLGFTTEDRWMIGLDNIESMDSLVAVQTIETLKQNLLDLDEVEAVSFTTSMAPFKNSQWKTGLEFNETTHSTMVVPSDLDLAEVLDVNITSGRWFNEDDKNAPIPPIILNQKLVDDFFEGNTMIDSIVELNKPMKVIGVVSAYKYVGEFAEDDPTVMIYEEYTKNMDWAILRMQPNTPTAFEEKLSQVINTSTKTTGSIIQNMEKVRVDDSRESWIMFTALLSICAFLCLNVALGLFGVLWYNISKRKSEIGLRQAVGAYSFDITKQFVLEIMILTGIALLIGIFFAVQIPILDVTEFPDSMFYKSIIYSSMIILTLVFVCALFPSIQAAKISPADSLHED